LIAAGIVVIFFSSVLNEFYKAHFSGDLLELIGTLFAAAGAWIIIWTISENRFVHAFLYAACFLLLLARLSDFTEEISALKGVPFFGRDGLLQDPVVQLGGLFGYVFLLGTFLGVLHEVATLRERSEDEHQRYRELHESTVLLAQVVDRAGDAVIGTDNRGHIRTWNEGAKLLFGYNRNEVRGRPLLDLLEFEAAGPEANPLSHLGDEPLTNVESRARRRSGGTFQAASTISVVKDETETRVGLSVIVRDIEQQKAKERELLASRNILEGAVQNADVGAFIAGRDDTFIEYNARMEALTGYAKEDVPSLHEFATRICDPKERVWETIMDRVMTRGFPADFRNLTMLHCDGNERVCTLAVSPVWDEENRIVAAAGIVVDLTERELLQAKLLQAQKMDSIGRLAGGIAHDFNNILGGILGYASLLVDEMETDSEHWRYAQAIEDSAARAAELTKQLLAFAKGSERHLERTSLNKVVVETLKLFAGGVKPNVSVSFRPEEKIFSIEADPSQLQQVVLNLCINARDAVEESGTITVCTENVTADDSLARRLRLEPNKGYVRLVVEDDGCGMSQDVAERAFEPFFSTKTQGTGYGLGMSVVYGIVEAHGGTMHIESEEGKGTRVEVYFPSSGSPYKESSFTTLAHALPRRGSETILVVDDEQLIRSLVQDVFGGQGYTVLEASSGEEALNLYDERGNEIDLVIMDLIMPGMGGAAALKRLQERNPGARVIISSGYGVEALDMTELDESNIRFVQKPYQASILVQEVRELIDL